MLWALPRSWWRLWLRYDLSERRQRLLLALSLIAACFLLSTVYLALRAFFPDDGGGAAAAVGAGTPGPSGVHLLNSTLASAGVVVNFDARVSEVRRQLASLADPEAKAAYLRGLFKRPRPKYFLAACAKVGMRNELPYMIEWLEYHRLAGFDRIVLYVDDVLDEGKNDYRLLEQYYTEELQEPEFLRVKSLSPLLYDSLADFVSPSIYAFQPTNTHRITQQNVIKTCHAELAGETEWFAHFDIDEFWVVDKPKRGPNANGDLMTIREYLEDFYTQDGVPANFYMFNSLAVLYGTNYNFGLGSAKSLFGPRLSVVEEPLTIEIKFLAASNRLVWNEATLQERTHKQRTENLKNLQRRLVKAKERNETAFVAFTDLAKHGLDETLDDFSLLLETATLSIPAARYGTPADVVLDVHRKAKPECAKTLDLFKDASGMKMVAENKVLEIAKRAKNHPVECRPGRLSPKLTAMGKSLTWTGNRHNPPGWYEKWKVDQIIADEQALAAKKGGALAGAAKRLSLLRRADRSDARSVVGELKQNGMRGQPGVLLESELHLKLWSDSRQNNGRRARYHRGFTDHNKYPLYCVQPWVHGCSHSSRAIQLLFPPEARVQHYMMRSIEARTVKDARWRKGKTGWGKFEGKSAKEEFEIIEFTNAIDHPPLPVLSRLRTTIDNRFGPNMIRKYSNITHPLLEPENNSLAPFSGNPLPVEWQEENVCDPCPKAFPEASRPYLCSSSQKGFVDPNSVCFQNFNS